jgi:hypothetical protein
MEGLTPSRWTKFIIMKKKLYEKLIYDNPLKMRIPVPKPGHAIDSKRKIKKVKITIDNWEKFC